MTHEASSYPLNEAKPYPHEQWWVAAYSSEVSRALIQRTILDRPIVLYRTESGDPVALAALCPHRLYPLMRSKLQGDSVQCGYHGFTFDKTGRCVRIPSQDKVPPKFGIRHYPTVEREGLIWLWSGKESSAAIELSVDRFADTRRELSCMADAGAIQVRKRLAAQIRRELSAEVLLTGQGTAAN